MSRRPLIAMLAAQASNDRVHRPPARGRHARLEAQTPDDIFKRDLAPLFRCERGIHGDPVGAFDIGAFEFAQMQIADPKSCTRSARICASSVPRQVTVTI